MAVITQMSRFTDVITGFAIKEVPPTPNAQIVVGTPGTMAELIQKRIIDGSKIKVFVLDEADNMLDTGSMGDQTLRVKKYAVCSQAFHRLTYSIVESTRMRRSSCSRRRSPHMSGYSLRSLLPMRMRSCCVQRSYL